MILLSQGLPHARLRQLHLDAQDGVDDPPPEHHRDDLQPGGRASAGGRRHVPRPGHAQGALRGRGRLHRLPAVRDRLHRGGARPVQRGPRRPARRATSRSPRPCPRRPSSTAPAARPARTRARPGSRRTGTCPSSGAARTRRPSSWCSTPTPLVGTLGRACYAPCEGECTRGSLEGTLPIRRIKRFIADAHDAAGDGRRHRDVAPSNGRRVAIVGSGPTGLTAAWQLARMGYGVKIFEAAPEPGGFLRLGIPSYRLPDDVGRAGHRQRARARRRDRARTARSATRPPCARPASTRCCVATGTHRSLGLGVPGEDRLGVLGGTDFLRRVKLGQPMDLAGKRVVVVGGGNVAMDAARTARRLGAASVTVAYRRGRDEMPAHHVEVGDAEREGVAFSLLVAPTEVLGDEHGEVNGLRCTRMRLGEPDASGRRRPEPVPGSEDVLAGRPRHRGDRHAPGHRGLRRPHGDRRPRPRSARTRSRCQTEHAVRLRRGRRGQRRPRTSPAPSARAGCAAHMIDRCAHRRGPGRLRRPAAGRGQGSRSSPARRRTPSARRHPTACAWSRAPTDFREVEAAADRGRGPRRAPAAASTARSAPNATSAWRPARSTGASTSTPATESFEVDRGRGRRLHRASSCSPRTSSRSTGSGASRTSSRACRWTACWRPPARSTRSCARATARSPSGSPTSCARARATRPSATRSARGSAACTRSSRTSCSWAPCRWPT